MTTSVKSSRPDRDARMNVLFTCVGRRVALIRLFREAMTELGLDGNLIGADVTTAAPGLHVVDVAELVPPARSAEYIAHLMNLVDRHKVRLLIPLTDLDLSILSIHQDEFAARGCTVMISPPDIVAACGNKITFNKMLRPAGLRGIRTETLETFRADPFYPCFVKPIAGSAAIGAGCIRNEQELKVHIATFGEQLMVQEWVPGQEFTMDIFRRRDGEVCAIVPRQRLSIRAGEVEKGITRNEPRLIEATRRLIDGMPGMWGVVNAQCRLADDGEPRFFEANLRFGGGATLSIAAGVNLPKFVLMETLGLPVEPIVGRFTDKLLMLRYEDAIYTPVNDPSQLPGYQEPLVK
jgi:carbamoyl-phosphate synthase large subunit